MNNLKNGTVLLDVSQFSKLRMTREPKIILVNETQNQNQSQSMTASQKFEL